MGIIRGDASNPGYIEMVRGVLQHYFPDLALAPEDVQQVERRMGVVPFPRSFTCDCKRCTSSWQEFALAGGHIAITTATMVHEVDLPGVAETFEHEWDVSLPVSQDVTSKPLFAMFLLS